MGNCASTTVEAQPVNAACEGGILTLCDDGVEE